MTTVRKEAMETLVDPNGGREAEAKRLATLKIVGGLLGAGLIIVQLVAWQCTLNCSLVSVLAAGAVAAVGAGFGCLFGVPRRLSGNSAAADQIASTAATKAYEDQGGLEQIADWLTKILLGAGLTQLSTLRTEGLKVADLMGGCVLSCYPDCGRLFGLAVLGYFGTFGFYGGYLAMKLFLAAMLAREGQYVNTIAAGRAIAEVVNRKTSTSQNAATVEALKSNIREGSGPAVLQEAEAWKPSGVETNKNDPMKGRFGGMAQRNDRQLCATVKEVDDSGGDLFTVSLQVKTTNPSNPLLGPVKFFLHDTFKPNEVLVLPVENVASFQVIAWGAFTVGAITDGGNTMLELDLEELPDAPKVFRSR